MLLFARRARKLFVVVIPADSSRVLHLEGRGKEPLGVVLGEIPVVARLAFGSERLTLFVTEKGVVAAHLGKRGAGAMATTSFFGRLSGALEDLFKSGKESFQKRSLSQLSPGQILAVDKDNFYIADEEVVSVEVSEISSTTIITVLTRQEKFEFRTRLGSERVVGLLGEAFGSKLVVSGSG